MITIQYTGQFGNCMFQYAFARLHANHNRMNLVTHGPIELETAPQTIFNEPPKKGSIRVTDETYHRHRLLDSSNIMQLDPEYDYIFDGYFQDAEIYNNNAQTIRGFFKLDYPEPNKDECLVLVRLGDFIHSGPNSEIIHYEWYKNILSKIYKQKVFSITSNGLSRSPSTKEQEEKYLKEIIHDNDRILTSDANMLKEFLEVMEYKTIVCSNSTWAWWACFLSKATNIYTFSKFGSFGVEEIKSHGIHINNLANIRNISQIIDGDFINTTLL